ncbi:MAG TPA: type II secretion system minor pseudopilin GspK [Burkholderiaceae bacterium]|nr:type II secretion system minor pseudopilin GspK [Burkholderiaceae bacterium]
MNIDSVAQRGAALLSAMLTVTLVATFAAAALWQQYRSIEVEKAERGRVQVAWLLIGALDWSRLILRIDGKAGTTDHLAEPWAVALQESRLSTFLAADQNNTGGLTAEESIDAFLSGQVVDAQSKLNIYNIIDKGTVSQPDFDAFSRLFNLMNIPISELENMTKQIKLATDTDSNNPIAPLMPHRIHQLSWLGLSATTFQKLAPYIQLINERTPVNLNTAPAEVIFAVIPDLQIADAKLAIATREQKHFSSLEDAAQLNPAFGKKLTPNQHSVSTRFFEVRGRLRLDSVVVEEQSLVRRDNLNNVQTQWRERATVTSLQ